MVALVSVSPYPLSMRRDVDSPVRGLVSSNEDMDRIIFKINGVTYSVGSEVSSDVMLLDYIRNSLQLRGTKYMCRAAGCGACIVSAVKNPGGPTVSINSCMVSITSCQDWEITTIEELGNRKKGYHVVQKTLAEYNGTQCGYCSPGWVMAMYSLLRNRRDLTMLEIEQSFGSNVCRCTGYRPILEAFKTFGKDAPKQTCITDIEDLNICEGTGDHCAHSKDDADWCIVSKDDVTAPNITEIHLKDNRSWFRVSKIADIFSVFQKTDSVSYMLVAGNTAKGVYPIDEYPRILIDISGVHELIGFELDQNLIIRAGTTLTKLLDIFESVSKKRCFSYLRKFYDHLLLVAHIAVRNLGSIAGNLMIKHQHNEFQSDLFLLFETVGAQLTILNRKGAKESMSMQQFLQYKMEKAIIMNVMLPPLNEENNVVTFKIMPRSQNAHATVHSGFLYKYNKCDTKVLQCRLVFGGLSPSFTRATATEKYLVGKSLFANATLQTAIAILDKEMIVTENPPEPSAAFRKRLAIGLFYKGLLSLCPENILHQRYHSGVVKLHETRPVSDAKQIFVTDPSLWPLNQPIPKIEGLVIDSPVRGLVSSNEDMDRIIFKINGVIYSVGSEVSSDVMLLDYIRNSLQLRGTKYMCRAAGCGACIVSAVKNPGGPTVSINSCMVSITSCQDWDITTIEELGNRKKGYHVVQKTLAEYNGTQCGYCSPGWVMAMYSLLRNRRDLTMLEIEQSFGSNVCRCTGYRPILEAFKTFGKDAPKQTCITDIEDLNICEETGDHCAHSKDDADWCIVSKDDVTAPNITEIHLKDNRSWFRVSKIADIFSVFQKTDSVSYMLVAGNTAKGVYPIDEYPRILIDISGVHELIGFELDQNLIIRAGTTLTKLLDIFESVSKKRCFSYLRKFYDHLLLVAHIAVRNLGSIAGNLMIKHQHNEFQSDLFLLFETVGAQLTILNRKGAKESMSMQQFLQYKMEKAIIMNVMLPPLNEENNIVTFKIMPRSQNAHATVHSGFLYKYNKCDTKVLQCRLVFGGLSPSFTRATATEKYLVGKSLFANETLQSAIAILDKEMIVTENPPEPSAAFRKRLAIGLFYKGLLSLCPENILHQRYHSGVVKLHETRPVSDAKQIFVTDPSLWPLNQPIPKIEGLIQCAGEAMYTEDLPSFPDEVFGALVLSTISRGYIVSINPGKALKQPGVIAFYSAKDIPGLNSFTPADDSVYSLNEELLCSGEVKYYNQPIGIIVAETQHIADISAKMVDVIHRNVKQPILDIKEAKKDPNRITLFASSDATNRGNDVAKVIRGSNTIYGQYHFTMETVTCVTRPTEEGLEVFATTQWLDATQVMISRALNMDANRIDVHVRRVGGAYGIKISRSIQVAVACSLIVQKLNRPCRFIQSMTANTRAFGKRFPCSSDYEFGVNKSGVIQYANYEIFEDNGYTINEKLTQFGFNVFSNCYESSRWNYKCFDAVTDTAKNTWFRAPGTLESIAMTEMAMEHISYEISMDPMELRLANLHSQYDTIIKNMLETVKTDSQYTERRAAVNKFNAENRWKKRGLRFVPLRWTHVYGRYFDVNMSVYHGDGTVAIMHGGVEIGQGINTKAAQICAYFLKIPLSKIQVKANNTINTPNSAVTGGSLTSQNIGVGVERCCKELLERLQPIRKQMSNPSWEELIAQAFVSSVDLQTHGFVNANDTQNYNVYGVALAEVEIDAITGEMEVLRVDVTEDVGQSVSPEIDIGQVEGAFIMGLGYWTCENLVYSNTGELLTDRTWNYYVPLARDIPQVFNVYFRKNSYGNRTILGSKVTGEPPICMAVVVPFAIREAIVASRVDSGIPSTTWFPFDGPYTTENICMQTCINYKEFKFY